jgi:hypothetical protein
VLKEGVQDGGPKVSTGLSRSISIVVWEKHIGVCSEQCFRLLHVGPSKYTHANNDNILDLVSHCESEDVEPSVKDEKNWN